MRQYPNTAEDGFLRLTTHPRTQNQTGPMFPTSTKHPLVALQRRGSPSGDVGGLRRPQDVRVGAEHAAAVGAHLSGARGDVAAGGRPGTAARLIPGAQRQHLRGLQLGHRPGRRGRRGDQRQPSWRKIHHHRPDWRCAQEKCRSCVRFSCCAVGGWVIWHCTMRKLDCMGRRASRFSRLSRVYEVS